MEISKEILDFRELTLNSDTRRDCGLEVPACLDIYKNIKYSTDSKWNLLDIYKLKGTENPQPVIISVHGGGWIYGDKEIYKWYCMDLARRGFAVVNFSYRLAPENPFPAALEDINDVFLWIKENYIQYNLDLEHLFVVGDSAGAQLGAQYCAMLSNPEYGMMYDFSIPYDITIKAAAFNCGVYDLKTYLKENDNAFLTAYLGKNINDNVNKCNLVEYVNSKFPPSYIMTSEYDFLKKYSYPMHIVLKKNNVYSEYHKFGEEKDVEMEHVFHLNLRLKQATICNNEECQFFKKFL